MSMAATLKSTFWKIIRKNDGGRLEAPFSLRFVDKKTEVNFIPLCYLLITSYATDTFMKYVSRCRNMIYILLLANNEHVGTMK